MEKQELICIMCPRSCRLTVSGSDGSLAVEGNMCPRGHEYALSEAVHPMRILTGIMRVEGIKEPLSIKTTQMIPKELLLRAMDEIHKVKAKAPVKAGDIIISDILGTGADVVATKSIK